MGWQALAACERDSTDVADDGRANSGPALGVAKMLSGDVITPFQTDTDNQTPFAVSDQITPPDTDWLSVLMCRERTGPS